MANQTPIKVMCDGSGNTCGLAQFTSSDSVAIAAGGTGLTSQGICEFVQPGLYAVGCQVTYLGICAGKADTGVGYDNTYVGHSAGTAATTACRHTIIGSQAGKAITTCSGTVAIGYNAAVAQTFGDFNTYVGTAAGAAVTTASNNTIIGYHAATATICSNNIVIGTCAMVANTQGQDNVAIGLKAGATQVAAGCNNVFVGSCVGAVALCRDNTIVGAKAGIAQTTGVKNVFLGACVGYGVQGGSNNVYVGDQAGLVNTSGNANVFIGNCAGAASTASCVLIIGNGASDLVVGCFASGIIKINNAYCLPAADGSASQFLCTDGSGALAFATLVSSPWSTSGCFITVPNGCHVGIGATSPTDALSVVIDEASMTCGIVVYNQNTAGFGPAIRFESDYDSSRGIHSAINGNADGAGGALSFHTSADNSALTRHMIIKPDGKVGIGTPNPNSTLELCTSNCTTCFTMVSNGNADVPGIKFCSGAAVQPIFSICGCWGGGTIFQDAHCGMAHAFQTCAVTRVTIDNAGKVGIGNTTPSTYSSSSGASLVIGTGSAYDGLSIITATTGSGRIGFGDGSGDPGQWQGIIDYNHSIDRMYFYTCNTSRFAIMNDQWVIIGTNFDTDTSTTGIRFHPTAGIGYFTSDGNPVLYVTRTTSTGTMITFNNGTSEVGSISRGASSTAYNTSSDYRLKENVVDLTGAVNRVAQLQPHRFNFIADPDTTVDGFVAHEVFDIVPEAITGTKDGMKDLENVVVDADGGIVGRDQTEANWLAGKEPTLVSEATEDEEAVYDDPTYAADTVWHETLTVPDYQGIDQAKLVPLLTAAIQELQTRLEAAESKIAALEAA